MALIAKVFSQVEIDVSKIEKGELNFFLTSVHSFIICIQYKIIHDNNNNNSYETYSIWKKNSLWWLCCFVDVYFCWKKNNKQQSMSQATGWIDDERLLIENTFTCKWHRTIIFDYNPHVLYTEIFFFSVSKCKNLILFSARLCNQTSHAYSCPWYAVYGDYLLSNIN